MELLRSVPGMLLWGQNEFTGSVISRIEAYQSIFGAWKRVFSKFGGGFLTTWACAAYRPFTPQCAALKVRVIFLSHCCVTSVRNFVDRTRPREVTAWDTTMSPLFLMVKLCHTSTKSYTVVYLSHTAVSLNHMIMYLSYTGVRRTRTVHMTVCRFKS
ncbi:hypothetical protein EPI10_010494 [Gossypium australe]|uniref:Uncharacterized protein n=1 Tax=Gossypium australe TaxID=47621 RepID=A0A5B6W607_9ROSI|nr:hypothetical protein EPI10_010494 [Gossypium australe]